MKSVNVIVGLGILAKEKEQRCHLEGNVMKRCGRVRLLTVCIMFGVISIFGCGEAKRSHKMNDAKTEESSGQADDAETEESSDKPYNKDDRGSIDRKDNIGYANNRGKRITYEDGYCYYYASQTDNYFLYRAREDGSDAVCLPGRASSGFGWEQEELPESGSRKKGFRSQSRHLCRRKRWPGLRLPFINIWKTGMKMDGGCD